MKSNVLGSFVALGLVLAACGDDVTVNGGGNAGGGTDGGGDTGGTPNVGGIPNIGGNGDGGNGGNPGDGNDTIATADPLEEDTGVSSIQSDLDPADTDVDFFSFNGVAGPTWIVTDAKPDDDPFADGFMDLVVTLYDANGNQMAQNDDPFPRTTQDAAIYTILPANGQYFLKVEEFCEFAPANTCDPDYFDNLRSLNYAVNVIPLDPSENSVMDEAPEENDTVATATDMEYEPNPNAQNPVGYYLTIAYGDWDDAADVDGVAISVPNDVYVDPDSRLNMSLVLPPPGSDGNGSGFNPGIVEVRDGANAVVSRFDMSNEDASTDRAELSFPGVLGGQYFVTIARGGATDTTDPFYFFIHSVGSGNPLETQEASNNNLATSEALTQAQGVQSYFIEGDLGAADVDHFSVGVLDEGFTVTCSGQRGGSGLQGFKATVLQASNGQAVAGASASTESATDPLLVQDLPVPATETALVVKLEKSGQDATNIGTYYRCGLHFNVLP